MDKNTVKELVKKGYGEVAKNRDSSDMSIYTEDGSGPAVRKFSEGVGYSDQEMGAVPDGANLGLGCGNPTALASLNEGKTVLDLGSGAGFDCFLAANKVGKNGKVIGVDMTPEMVEKARQNAINGNYTNVEFRLGDIENLPVTDNSVDVIVSNCVINLAPDKQAVFKEAFRVLRKGGRLMVSDMVLLQTLPENIQESIEAYVACLGGASLKVDYIDAIKSAGFQDIRIINETSLPFELLTNDPMVKTIVEKLNISPAMVREIAASFVSIKVQGTK
jgi:arsenite methyltransferase